IDPGLAARLESCGPDETLTVFLTLQKLQDAPPFERSAKEFKTRQAWRVALEEHRLKQVQIEMGPTIAELERRGLQPYGQMLGNTVVIQGNAAQIREALKVSGIQHAMLDFAVTAEA